MATSQTTPPSTDLVYTEPALTAELLDRFDTFARERTLTPPRLFLAEDGGTSAAAFVALTPVSDEDGGVIEAAVAPAYRGRGAGSAFFEHAVRQLGEDAVRYRLWVHGSANDTGIETPAHAFATLHGFSPVRVLYKMVLPLDESTREDLVERSDARALPENLRMRTYTGADEFPWLRVNAAAFAHHPEQGKLTLADLRERTGSDWFRPEGFFIASEKEDQDSDRAGEGRALPRRRNLRGGSEPRLAGRRPGPHPDPASAGLSGVGRRRIGRAPARHRALRGCRQHRGLLAVHLVGIQRGHGGPHVRSQSRRLALPHASPRRPH